VRRQRRRAHQPQRRLLQVTLFFSISSSLPYASSADSCIGDHRSSPVLRMHAGLTDDREGRPDGVRHHQMDGWMLAIDQMNIQLAGPAVGENRSIQ
jgi:hypothetical protein